MPSYVKKKTIVILQNGSQQNQVIHQKFTILWFERSSFEHVSFSVCLQMQLIIYSKSCPLNCKNTQKYPCLTKNLICIELKHYHKNTPQITILFHVLQCLILKNLRDAQNVKKVKTETQSAATNVTNGFTGMFFNTNRWRMVFHS